jgi:hypothetical protein
MDSQEPMSCCPEEEQPAVETCCPSGEPSQASCDKCSCKISAVPEPIAKQPELNLAPLLMAVAVLPEQSLQTPALEQAVEPGIFGIDAGPPISVRFRPDLGRAPPVCG